MKDESVFDREIAKKVIIDDNKKTTEISPFFDHLFLDEIEDSFDIIEAKPYLDIYNSKKNYILKEFNRDRNSRRVVITFDNNFLYSDIPNCIVCIHFVIRDNILNCCAYARSTDIKKYKNDLCTIKYFLLDLSDELNVDLGIINFISGSFHKYED